MKVMFLMMQKNYKMEFGKELKWIIEQMVLMMGVKIRKWLKKRNERKGNKKWKWIVKVILLIIIWI